MSSDGQPLRLSHTNKSGTITVGGTAQAASPSTRMRSFLIIQNPKTETETLFVNFDATAAATGTSIGLESGERLIFEHIVPTGAISVVAATTGHKFVIKES